MVNVYANLDFLFGKDYVVNVQKVLVQLLIDLHVFALITNYINQ